MKRLLAPCVRRLHQSVIVIAPISLGLRSSSMSDRINCQHVPPWPGPCESRWFWCICVSRHLMGSFGCDKHTAPRIARPIHPAAVFGSCYQCGPWWRTHSGRFMSLRSEANWLKGCNIYTEPCVLGMGGREEIKNYFWGIFIRKVSKARETELLVRNVARSRIDAKKFLLVCFIGMALTVCLRPCGLSSYSSQMVDFVRKLFFF